MSKSPSKSKSSSIISDVSALNLPTLLDDQDPVNGVPSFDQTITS